MLCTDPQNNHSYIDLNLVYFLYYLRKKKKYIVLLCCLVFVTFSVCELLILCLPCLYRYHVGTIKLFCLHMMSVTLCFINRLSVHIYREIELDCDPMIAADVNMKRIGLWYQYIFLTTVSLGMNDAGLWYIHQLYVWPT